MARLASRAAEQSRLAARSRPPRLKRIEMTTPLVEERGKPETNGRGTLAIPHFNVPPLRADRQRHYTPWLVIRYDAGDYGGRPLPAGTVFWESPDVWVTST